ncbi:MAG: WXG100 family type VII secretion target [Chloroflexota bacterium]
MTTLHMDIDAMLRIQHSLLDIQGKIRDRSQALRRNYQGLPHHWIGNSANEYFDYYNEFDGQITTIVERLGEIASELSVEIANYESLDDGFGD